MRAHFLGALALVACVGDNTVVADGGSDGTTNDAPVGDSGGDAIADAGPWSPAVLDGDGSLALWLEAADANVTISSGQVGVWRDLSKNHNDAKNGSAGPTLKAGAINGRESLVFDVDGVNLAITDNASLQFGTDQIVIMSVVKALTPGVYSFSKARTKGGGAGVFFYTGIELYDDFEVLGDGGSGLTPVLTLLEDATDSGVTNGITTWWPEPTIEDAKFHIIGIRRTSSTNTQMFVDDGTPQAMTGTAPDVSSVGFDVQIGSIHYGNKAATVNGEIAAVIAVHSTVIADATVTSLHGYLKQRYAL